jgi:hypothetical protein
MLDYDSDCVARELCDLRDFKILAVALPFLVVLNEALF